jgi:hypothetical protein
MATSGKQCFSFNSSPPWNDGGVAVDRRRLGRPGYVALTRIETKPDVE